MQGWTVNISYTAFDFEEVEQAAAFAKEAAEHIRDKDDLRRIEICTTQEDEE